MHRKPNFERILKTFRCHEPDSVPLAELVVDMPIREIFFGKPVREMKSDVEFWHRAGYDYISAAESLLRSFPKAGGVIHPINNVPKSWGVLWALRQPKLKGK